MRCGQGASTVHRDRRPLVLILYYLFIKAADAWIPDFFTTAHRQLPRDPSRGIKARSGHHRDRALATCRSAVPICIGVAL